MGAAREGLVGFVTPWLRWISWPLGAILWTVLLAARVASPARRRVGFRASLIFADEMTGHLLCRLLGCGESFPRPVLADLASRMYSWMDVL